MKRQIWWLWNETKAVKANRLLAFNGLWIFHDKLRIFQNVIGLSRLFLSAIKCYCQFTEAFLNSGTFRKLLNVENHAENMGNRTRKLQIRIKSFSFYSFRFKFCQNCLFQDKAGLTHSRIMNELLKFRCESKKFFDDNHPSYFLCTMY